MDFQKLLFSSSHNGLLRLEAGADSALWEPIIDQGHRNGTVIT